MKIGITGADGLLGFHLRALLHARQEAQEVRLATRETFRDDTSLDRFVLGLDAIIHCAGMNRGGEAEVESVNLLLAADLVAALERTGSWTRVIYANSTHHVRDTAYGRGKRAAGELLERWGHSSDSPVSNIVLPHVFGEFGKPFYNSVVSTFCHQLATGGTPQIEVDGELELVHAQEVASLFVEQLTSARNAGATEGLRMKGRTLKVSELLTRLQELFERYRNNVFPDLRDPLDLRLFNTLRSYLFPAYYPRPLQLHSDLRGDLFEAVKSDEGGQAFMSSTHPGITRGNHYHLRKVERFLVIGGEAEIRLRRLFSDEIVSFKVSGRQPVFVDMPTFHTHSITNIGSSELQTLFWSNEIFDPNNADTYAEAVDK